MITSIYHVGVTVSDIDRSIQFYRGVLELSFQGELVMKGEATQRLFAMKGYQARVACLNGSSHLEAPPVELLQWIRTGTNSGGNMI